MGGVPIADLRRQMGEMGETATPDDQNSSWCHLIGEMLAPYHDRNALSFNCFDLNVGKHKNEGVI